VIEEVRFAIDALVEASEPSVPREKDPLVERVCPYGNRAGYGQPIAAAAGGEWRLVAAKVLPARSAALNDKLFLADEAVRGFLVTLDFLGQFLDSFRIDLLGAIDQTSTSSLPKCRVVAATPRLSWRR
jgi:hypothetical protein